MNRAGSVRRSSRFGLRFAGALVSAGILAACASDADVPSAFSVERDTTNGVEYVRHTGDRDAAPLALEISIGRLGASSDEASPEEFGRVESVLADEAGRMYVADGFAMEIRVFSPEGAFERRIGRAGEGPGEIGGMHGIAWLAGDTLVVVDYGNARLGLVSSSGAALGQWPWVRLTGGTRAGPTRWVIA